MLGAAREPVWVDDDVYFQIEDHGNVPLYRVRGGRVGKARGSRRRRAGGHGLRRRRRHDRVHRSTATSTRELFVSRRASGQRASASGLRRAGSSSLPSGSPLHPATAKRSRPGSCAPPASRKGKKYPAILNIHGGPFSQYANRVFDEFQIQAGAGFVVLYANPRGSSGYGAGVRPRDPRSHSGHRAGYRLGRHRLTTTSWPSSTRR